MEFYVNRQVVAHFLYTFLRLFSHDYVILQICDHPLDPSWAITTGSSVCEQFAVTLFRIKLIAILKLLRHFS